MVNRILDLVRTGMLRAGDRLPSERELIDIFGISRPSLREALRALSILGVVDSRHGGGAYVTDLEARTLLAPLDFFLSLSETNLADAFEARRIVEIAIVRRAAAEATAEDVDELRGMLAAHAKLFADPVGFRILDSRFHARLSATAGNVVLERLAYALYNMGLDIRRRATEDLALIRRSLDEHTAIVRAIAAGDPDGGGARHGRPPRPHRGEHPRRDRAATSPPPDPALRRADERSRPALDLQARCEMIRVVCPLSAAGRRENHGRDLTPDTDARAPPCSAPPARWARSRRWRPTTRRRSASSAR